MHGAETGKLHCRGRRARGFGCKDAVLDADMIPSLLKQRDQVGLAPGIWCSGL